VPRNDEKADDAEEDEDDTDENDDVGELDGLVRRLAKASLGRMEPRMPAFLPPAPPLRLRASSLAAA
jgi:hypothetical protein